MRSMLHSRSSFPQLQDSPKPTRPNRKSSARARAGRDTPPAVPGHSPPGTSLRKGDNVSRSRGTTRRPSREGEEGTCMMRRLNLTDRKGDVVIEDPPIAKLLFSSTKLAWVWLVLRLWLGYEWLEAAAHKVVDPAWMVSGSAIRAFWERAVTPNPATGN